MTDAVCNMKKDDVDRLKYIQAVDLLNEEEDNLDFDKSLWDVHRVLRHRGEHKKVEIYVEFKDPNKRKQWVSLFAIALQDPIPILKYAKNKKLLGKSPFKILVNHCSGDAPSQLVKAFKTAGKPGDPKFKFGVQVPLGVEQALSLDQQNGNHHWRYACNQKGIESVGGITGLQSTGRR